MTLHDALARGRVTAGGRDYPVPGGMLETAENLRREYGITREEQDELALRSHQRAVAAQRDGRFAEEIVPVTVTDPPRRGGRRHRRAPARRHHARGAGRAAARCCCEQDPEATVTAGNASGQNDGAAVCIVTHPRTSRASWGCGRSPASCRGRWPGCRPRPWASVPCPATAKALERAGLKLADIDLIELNEAFAAQVLACTREWGFGEADFERLNVNGSGISLGHPVGATGGRILATLLREMRAARGPLRARDDVHRRRSGPRRGLRDEWPDNTM